MNLINSFYFKTMFLNFVIFQFQEICTLGSIPYLDLIYDHNCLFLVLKNTALGTGTIVRQVWH